MKKLHLTVTMILASLVTYAQSPVLQTAPIRPPEQGVKATVNKATQPGSHIRFTQQASPKLRGKTAREKAEDYIASNLQSIGVQASKTNFNFQKEQTDVIRYQHVRMQQTYDGVPIFDSGLNFHFNTNLELTSINGKVAKDIKVSARPTLTPEIAKEIAVGEIYRQNLFEKQAPAVKATLYIFDKGLKYGTNGLIVLVYEVEVTNRTDIREFIYVNAHSGVIEDQITGMHQALNRKLYNRTITEANLIWQEGDALPGTLTQWQESSVRSAGHTYHLMKNAFGIDSYNGLGAPMLSTHNNPSISCPNANWNGVSANYCDGIATDDVVAHEWAHAYIDYTSGLIYAYQSGALNESYADILGEVVDLINDFQDGPGDNDLRANNPASVRWILGDKSPVLDYALRDMADPNSKEQPAKISDAKFHCATSDIGGVHYNSGVNNHAFALLTDGGTFNGQTINGIGLTKATHIFWRAQNIYLTRTSTFSENADALITAATDYLLAGIDLPKLSVTEGDAGPSGQSITADDILELQKVILAVEMKDPIPCYFTVVLPDTPELCEGANKPDMQIFHESFEGSVAGWSTATTAIDPSEFTPRDWVIVNNLPYNRTGSSAYVPNDFPNCGGVSCQSGVIDLISPNISIPTTLGNQFQLSFYHLVSIEAGWDGGIIEYSINDGAFIQVPAAAFLANGYNGIIQITTDNTNPLIGKQAFTGQDGAPSSKSWGQSVIDLSHPDIALQSGQQIQFRWRLGTDIYGGSEGWFIDDVKLYSCATPAVHFDTGSTIAFESQAINNNDCLPYLEKVINVVIDKAPSSPVTVNISATGTATQGATADYTISPTSFVLSEASISQPITVRIYNDGYVEASESIELNLALSGGGDAYLASSLATHHIKIESDDVEPASNATIQVFTEDFNEALQNWTITNRGNSEDSWYRTDNNYGSTFNNSAFFAVASNLSASYNYTVLDEVATSPSFNTLGLKHITLTFKQLYAPRRNSNGEYSLVEVWDGHTWHTLLRQNESNGTIGNFTTPNTTVLSIPEAFANKEMKVRFRYIAQGDYFWFIDDISVTGRKDDAVGTQIAQAPAQYLGPYGTVNYFDQEGNILARIENLTDHDYGCTTVEIDRVGTGATQWVGAYNISNKTYKVTPTHNNPEGQYKITLYYTAAEVAEFTSIQSMGKSASFIGAGNLLSNSFAEVRTSAAYDSDVAFTATFDSGFSGFGLSDAPPIGALPVVWKSFEGMYTTDGNKLLWSTASETANAIFEVQRSTDAKQFTTIGTVKGQGTTQQATNYQFLDINHAEGVSYYRLKQIDLDGTAQYSALVSIQAPKAQQSFLYPNPVTTSLHLRIPNQMESNLKIGIMNMYGQQVYQAAYTTQQEKLTIPVENLPTGRYQVQIILENTTYYLPMLKH